MYKPFFRALYKEPYDLFSVLPVVRLLPRKIEKNKILFRDATMHSLCMLQCNSWKCRWEVWLFHEFLRACEESYQHGWHGFLCSCRSGWKLTGSDNAFRKIHGEGGPQTESARLPSRKTSLLIARPPFTSRFVESNQRGSTFFAYNMASFIFSEQYVIHIS